MLASVGHGFHGTLRPMRNGGVQAHLALAQTNPFLFLPYHLFWAGYAVLWQLQRPQSRKKLGSEDQNRGKESGPVLLVNGNVKLWPNAALQPSLLQARKKGLRSSIGVVGWSRKRKRPGNMPLPNFTGLNTDI